MVAVGEGAAAPADTPSDAEYIDDVPDRVREGKLRFVTRHGGKLTSLVVDKDFPKSAVKVFAQLQTNGTVTLKVDGKVVAEGKTPGPMFDMPLDGLEVGEDRNGAVGNYPADQKFKGTVKKLVLRLLK